MDFISLFFTVLCLIFLIVFIIVLYSVFKANDLFFAKLREYQNLSRKMFQQAEPAKKSVKSKRKSESKPQTKSNFEDAEYREI